MQRVLARVVLSFMLMVSLIVIQRQPAMSAVPQLLSDPFLQAPTGSSVRVVWFTEFEGIQHTVAYGPDLQQTVSAQTTMLSRTREDQESGWGEVTLEQAPVRRKIWRHEAAVTGLEAGDRVPYRVTSVTAEGQTVSSRTFTLAPSPEPGTPLKILLTSDHQLMPMTAANLQKVVETVGRVDAVFFAGDLVNVPDRASEWFDDRRGGAFFPCLQGRANYAIETAGGPIRYQGGEIIQHAPLFPTVGNHEVMGRFSHEQGLKHQFHDAVPRWVAQANYTAIAPQINRQADPMPDDWVKNASYNIDTYQEIFSLPSDRPAGKAYYATSFGDIRLISLYVTNVWRSPQPEPNRPGRYAESSDVLQDSDRWGYGQFIFEAIAPGSEQYEWLVQELNSPAFQQARYKVVMFHHPPHTLGGNIVPAYTDPVQVLERTTDGTLTAVRYDYPKAQDYIIRDVVPLLEQAGVQLVYFGHSHLWNRFVSPQGVHYLESSNVGNSYGAHWVDNPRPTPAGDQEDYVAVGNPNGLEPILPSISPLVNPEGQPIPYIASNEITVFSILDTGTGQVTSYRFDTRKPDATVERFDEFAIAAARPLSP